MLVDNQVTGQVKGRRLIESLAPGLTVRDIMDEFGLVSYRDYIARCTEFRAEALGLPAFG